MRGRSEDQAAKYEQAQTVLAEALVEGAQHDPKGVTMKELCVHVGKLGYPVNVPGMHLRVDNLRERGFRVTRRRMPPGYGTAGRRAQGYWIDAIR